jgi:O-antigen/teichoic acid export membrane protein
MNQRVRRDQSSSRILGAWRRLPKDNNLLAGSAVYFVSNVLNAIVPFLLLPILTRYLTPSQYGEVAIFQTLLGALIAFVGLSMAGAARRKYYDADMNEYELAQFIGSCLQVLVFTSFVTFLFLLLMSKQLSGWIGLRPIWILLAVVVTASTVIIQLRLGQWQVRKQAKRYGFMQVSHSLMNFIFSLALVVVFSGGAEGRLTAQLFATLFVSFLALILLRRDNSFIFSVCRPDFIKEIGKFGIPLVPHVCGVFMLASADRFVINLELGLASAGIYMVAVQFSAILSLVFDALNKAYVPWLFEKLNLDDVNENRKIVIGTYIWFFVVLVSAGVVYMVGPFLITAIAGEGYSEAGAVIGWLALGQAFGGMYLMVTNYIFYSKRTGLLSLVTIVSGSLNIILLIFFVPSFGIKGAAYAFCLSAFIRFILTWSVAQRKHSMPWFDF